MFLAKVQSLFPFFDGKALDAGRFFFGNPDAEVFTFPGTKTLTEFIAELEAERSVTDTPVEESHQSFSIPADSIPEGSRNSTLSHEAGKILKRWGDTAEAYQKYMAVAAKCAPPLPEQEVISVWKSAVRFFHEKVEKQPGYVSPAEYNAPAAHTWEPPIPFSQHTLPRFPVDALPPAIRDYVLAVAETTQTPADMAATAALAVLSLSQQGKYRIKGNNGTAAVISAEGGIFDMLAGIYTKNVNIDVFLKGHSGDDIRVDRIGRNSETIFHPALTVLLAVQPSVLSGLMSNATFRGRGLTARFMYCMPQSLVGNRKYRSEPIPNEIARCYEVLVRNLLQEERPQTPNLIYLSPEADRLLEQFAYEVEGKLKNEYADIPDWAGKLVGMVLRIAGLLCRASEAQCVDFLDIPESMIVSGESMAGAIAIGRYYTEHSRAAYSLMGADDLVKQSRYTLDAIVKNGLTEFTRRDIMRLCRSFKTADAVQPILNHLSDLGYVALKEPDSTPIRGRPANPTYLVNPLIYRQSA